MKNKDLVNYLGKKVTAVIDAETGETVWTTLMFDEPTSTYITECGYVVISIKP